MATDTSFAAWVLEQVDLPGRVDVRRMFGEYAVYVDGKVVALLCDNQFFLKPLAELRERLGRVEEAPPYPGAKPHFRLDELLERPAELTALLVEAAARLPVPKARTKTKTKTSTKETPTKHAKHAQKKASAKPPTRR